jgi:hypothetical protein
MATSTFIIIFFLLPSFHNPWIIVTVINYFLGASRTCICITNEWILASNLSLNHICNRTFPSFTFVVSLNDFFNVFGLGYFVHACVKILFLVMLELFYLLVTFKIMWRQFTYGMFYALGISFKEFELTIDSKRFDFLWRCRATTISMNNFVTHIRMIHYWGFWPPTYCLNNMLEICSSRKVIDMWHFHCCLYIHE